MIQDHCAGTASSATGTLTPQKIQITQAKDNCCKHYGCRGSDTLTPDSGAIFPTIIHKLPLQQSRKLQISYLVHPKKLFLMFLIILISLAYIHESALKESIHSVFVSSRSLCNDILPIASRESVSLYRFVHYLSFYHFKNLVCSHDGVLWSIPVCSWLWSQRKWACAVPSFLFPLISHIALKNLGQ